MTSPRIAVAGFQHETNTFAHVPTAWADFEHPGAWPGYVEGDGVLAAAADMPFPMAGFVAAAAGQGFDLVPLLWCGAEPGGTVEQATFDRIANRICDRLADAGPVDGVYLDLHGAMVTDDHVDGEAELLARVRAVVGPDLPVVASLDLHANISPALADAATALAIYRTYPHVDMPETGARAARVLGTILRAGHGHGDLHRVLVQAPFILPITTQSTRREPAGGVYRSLPSFEGEGVLGVDFAMGFPPADIPDCGPSVVASGPDAAAVANAADAIMAAIVAAEDAFADPMESAASAVGPAIAMGNSATRPVVIADPQDNPGAGAPGDATGVLRALLDTGARGAVLGVLWDPKTAAAAHAAGVDATLDVRIGGHAPGSVDLPVAIGATVERLSDGRFPFTGPMFGGGHAALGPMARLRLIHRAADVTVVVGSARAQNADQAMFRAVGIEPADWRIVCVKSAIHFMADYEPIAEAVLFAEAPGGNPCRVAAIPYTRLRPGIRLGPNGPVSGGP